MTHRQVSQPMQRAAAFYPCASVLPVFLSLGLPQLVVLESVFEINLERLSAITSDKPLRHASVAPLRLANMIPLRRVV